MSNLPVSRFQHNHHFHDTSTSGERRVSYVILLTGVMMVVEVAAGVMTNSIALLADGIHMGTHLAALSITVFAYWYARRHADDGRFTFGTGKVSTLGGFASAIFLAAVALFMAAESAARFFDPLDIQFDQAITVACIGLVVNLLSAVLLRDHHHHNHGHGHHGHGHGPRPHQHGPDRHGHHHDHEHDDHQHEQRHHHEHDAKLATDHNLRGAYLHVLADALTSLTAIIALSAGMLYGYVWMDPAMGVLGSLVVARWAYLLIKETAYVLVDGDHHGEIVDQVRASIESEPETRIADLHIWRVGPGNLAAILSIVTSIPHPPAYYKELLAPNDSLAHVTVEVIEPVDDVSVDTTGLRREER